MGDMLRKQVARGEDGDGPGRARERRHHGGHDPRAAREGRAVPQRCVGALAGFTADADAASVQVPLHGPTRHDARQVL